MNTWGPWFRRWHVLGGFLALFSIIVFVEGSALFDPLLHKAPEAEQILSAFAGSAPAALRPFSPNAVRAISDHSATVVAVLREPLYEPADPAAVAAKHGDDAAAFAQALAQRAELSPTDQPPLPTRRLPERIYAVARHPGDSLPIEIKFSAKRTTRGWSLLICYLIWTQPRLWEISGVTYSALPSEWASAKPRAELGPGAVTAGDRDGDAVLEAYYSERRTFVAQIKERLATVLERTVTAAVTADLTASLQPTSAFAVHVKVAPSSASGADKSVTADVQVEALRDLYVESTEALDKWKSDPLAGELADARQQVKDFQLPVAADGIVAPHFWAVAVAIHRTFAAKATVRIGGSPAQPVVQSLTWTQPPELPAGSLLTREQADASTVFPEGDPSLLTAASYRASVEKFIGQVKNACAAVEKQWGPDRSAWRIVIRAMAAEGGRTSILQNSSFIEELVDTAPKPMSVGRNLEYRSTRRIALPFQVREDFDFSNARQSITRIFSLGITGGHETRSQTLTLDDTGSWETTDGEMAPDDLFGPDEVGRQRHFKFARYALFHLASDPHWTLSALPGTSPLQVTASQPGWPSLTLTFDTRTGYLTGVSYRESLTKDSPLIEYHFADFRPVEGRVVSTTRTMAINGEVSVTERLQSVRPATFDRSDFRNPYSPGVPFTPTPGAASHQLTVINNHLDATVLVCFDDDPEGIALGFSERKARSLTAGAHACTIVTWYPQAVQNHPYRIERRTVHFNADRDGSLVISTDPRDQGNFLAQLQ